jgi:predicted unusual protein kinase regulating ubiquinone biosynthesis (AarF/ABC1/UbiB family)
MSTPNSISLKYNAAAIDQEYSGRPLEVWQRLVDIGSPLLGWWLCRKFDNITSSFRTYEENEALLNERAADLKNCIVQGKSVAFIKSGQALALRPDLVKSAEYVRELTKLQDEVGCFENDIAMRIFEEDIGLKATEVFDFFYPDPIASASIGQVYKARFKETGRVVAIKIQRPDVLETAEIDMFIIQRAAKYLKKRYKLKSDMLGIANEFGSQLFGELNYTQEALNCMKFKDMYGKIPGIYVPSVYMNFTSTRVLTMEFVEGTKGPWTSGGERMLTIGLQCSVLQLLECGFFHADPHRGNLLQTPDGKLAYLVVYSHSLV